MLPESIISCLAWFKKTVENISFVIIHISLMTHHAVLKRLIYSWLLDMKNLSLPAGSGRRQAAGWIFVGTQGEKYR